MSRPLLHWEHDSTYANWKMIHWTWTATEDLSTVLFFILSPDGKHCALVRNGLVLYTFGCLGARQDVELGCQSGIADALDDGYLGSGYDLDNEGRSFADDEEDDEDDEGDVEDEDDEESESEFRPKGHSAAQKRKPSSQFEDAMLDEELVGVEIVDLSNVDIQLGPTGNFAVFTIQKNDHSFIFQLRGLVRQPLIAGDLICTHFPDRGESYFLSCRSEDNEHFFIQSGRHFDGFLHDCGFSSSGEHSVGFFSPVVSATGAASDVTVVIDGNLVLTAARIQSWNHPGEGGSEACCKKRFEFDPNDRYLLFGVGFSAPDRGPETIVPAIQVFTFADRKLGQWPETRILSVSWSIDADLFELSVLSSLDRFRAPKSMRVPIVEN